MRWCFQDLRNVYMVLDYVVGGELFTYLGNLGQFTKRMTVFFAAEIVLVLEYLHSLGIVYRDLKPENVLIDRDGHIRITDFGFAKYLDDSTFTVCGTVDYLAPEIIKKQGHGFGVDIWAVGVLIYEMLAGVPPFDDDCQIAVCTRILDVDLDFPPEFDDDTIDIVEGLCTEEEEDRLGCGPRGFAEIKEHPFFSTVDWDAALKRKMMPPFVPAVDEEDDTSCFPDYDEVDVTALEAEDYDVDQELFSEFCKRE
ncbi:AGC/PKA protein kinase [Thecamonas trahens ATCC 50062]|uniref:AGC/PKA protein kinase n=1 Tax=Thecamonas trahens ATCC 50062 TaxID=461836 RepID=A0A0L0DLN0_THETB|nr:AGC/PKA protein kinase [Thecamonas trahens ATCC 50062]KNC52951.1 AGC/PKA protein kinase [Thecamonas trahens ATCC 50062]|eukprot:XP_013754845.1 AGC/PKA protein kinase [Thecamonas trahens ATCC 50062]